MLTSVNSQPPTPQLPTPDAHLAPPNVFLRVGSWRLALDTGPRLVNELDRSELRV